MVFGATTYRQVVRMPATGRRGPALVDRVQGTVFPVISGTTGMEPVSGGSEDFDLELVESWTIDGSTRELIHRPSRRHWA